MFNYILYDTYLKSKLITNFKHWVKDNELYNQLEETISQSSQGSFHHTLDCMVILTLVPVLDGQISYDDVGSHFIFYCSSGHI